MGSPAAEAKFGGLVGGAFELLAKGAGALRSGSSHRFRLTLCWRKRDSNPQSHHRKNGVRKRTTVELHPAKRYQSLREPRVPIRFPPLHHEPREGTEHNRAHSLLEARHSQYRGIEHAGLMVTAICIERVTNWGTFPWSPRRFVAKVGHNTRTGEKDGFWRGDVLHRLLDEPG